MSSPWDAVAPGRYVPPVDNSAELVRALRGILAVKGKLPSAYRVNVMRRIARDVLDRHARR